MSRVSGIVPHIVESLVNVRFLILWAVASSQHLSALDLGEGIPSERGAWAQERGRVRDWRECS